MALQVEETIVRVVGQELTRRVVHPVSLLEEGVIPFRFPKRCCQLADISAE